MRTSLTFKKVLLALLFVFTMFPAGAMAAVEDAVIVVDESYAKAGATVNVNVTVENNPGIIGGVLEFTYDPELTLIDAKVGDALSALTVTKPGNYTSPARFLIDTVSLNPEDIKNGVMLTLTFTVSENAAIDSKPAVRLKCEDFVDNDLNGLDVKSKDGYVEILSYTPGDLNDDGSITVKDVILARRSIVGGYEQNIIAAAADVNDDNKVNVTDVILIRRYIATGYDVTLLPHHERCSHDKTHVDAVAATCTEPGNIEYWYCSTCDLYFKDANSGVILNAEDIVTKAKGHTEVVDPRVEPTYETPGLTEGSHCSVCNTVIKAQEEIPQLEYEKYEITYHIDDNDKYLQSLDIENPNPTTYVSETGLQLVDLTVRGYDFGGWTLSDGTIITKIEKCETGEKHIYAKLTPHEYKVNFDSPLVPKESITYTTNVATPLDPPNELGGYYFMGWTDGSGNVITSIPQGAIGNRVLKANWTSRRNLTYPVENLGEPLIHEDSDAGKIFFIYEIGSIHNVPLSQIRRLESANGVVTVMEESSSTSIEEGNEKKIAEIISQATSDAQSWTLSSDWNTTTDVSESYLEQTGMDRETAETISKSSSGTYNTTNSSGGSNSTSSSTSNSSKTQASTADSTYSKTTDKQALELSVSAEVGVGYGPISASVSAGAKSSESSEQINIGTSSNSTFNENNSSSSNSSTASASWNSSNSYTQSNSSSTSTSVRNTISSLISNTWKYGESYSQGGENQEYKEYKSSDSKSNEYSSLFTYHTAKMDYSTKSYTINGEGNGAYRLVLAGIVHVFAVVEYDITTSSYSITKQGILDDETYTFIDYSRSETFADEENGVLPFEVPIEVKEIVDSRMCKTNGLKIDMETGMVTDYSGTDDIVFVPSYVRVTGNSDNKASFVKVTGISEKAFRGKNIQAISLGTNITEIANNAFEGCSNLKEICCPNVTKIGDNAFSGCTSLTEFTIPSSLTDLGDNAFEGVPSIKVNASSKAVALAAAASGADNVTLDLSYIPEEDSSGIELNVGEINSFALWGKNKEYKGLSLKSDAQTTSVVGVAFTENTKYPMELSSQNVTLERVTVDCNGLALVLKADTTNLILNHTVSLVSESENAVLCRNIALSELSSDYVGKLNVNGNILVCGSVSGRDLMTVSNGHIVLISEKEYENYLSSRMVTFDAAGGAVGTDSIMVAMYSAMGELPVPTRDYYSFDGWFTEKEGGTEVISETIMTSTEDMTLYAHWTQNGAQWALASEVPADAEIVDRKYTYNLISYTTSNSSTLSGWEQYNSTWAWGAYGSWSSWSKTKQTASDSKQVETKTVTDSAAYTEYHYDRWVSSDGYTVGTYGYNGVCYTYQEIYLRYALSYKSSTGMYGSYDNGLTWAKDYWFYVGSRNVAAVTHTEYRYRVRSKVYTYYYKKTEQLESAEYPTGENISDIVEYVQYRMK